MAKPSQTFKKRQRENKLREKAQMKRERRQQRREERKTSQGIEGREENVESHGSRVDPARPESALNPQLSTGGSHVKTA